MAGQIVAFAAFGIPMALRVLFRTRARVVLLAGAGGAGALVALAASGPSRDEYNQVTPLWLTILLIAGLLAVWCAGVGVGSFLRRRLSRPSA